MLETGIQNMKPANEINKEFGGGRRTMYNNNHQHNIIGTNQ